MSHRCRKCRPTMFWITGNLPQRRSGCHRHWDWIPCPCSCPPVWQDWWQSPLSPHSRWLPHWAWHVYQCSVWRGCRPRPLCSSHGCSCLTSCPSPSRLTYCRGVWCTVCRMNLSRNSCAAHCQHVRASLRVCFGQKLHSQPTASVKTPQSFSSFHFFLCLTLTEEKILHTLVLCKVTEKTSEKPNLFALFRVPVTLAEPTWWKKRVKSQIDLDFSEFQ